MVRKSADAAAFPAARTGGDVVRCVIDRHAGNADGKTFCRVRDIANPSRKARVLPSIHHHIGASAAGR